MMNEKRCCDCEHFGLSRDPIFGLMTGICGRRGKEVGYTDKCLFEEERNDDDIKFKLITYFDPDFEAKTQKCEYFIELEDGVERSLKDILIENVKLKEQQDTIFKLQDLCGKSDGENMKLRIENKRLEKEVNLLRPTNLEQYEQIQKLQEENEQLRAKLREKEQDERLYANEIVKLNKEAKEVLDFKSLGGDY